MSSTLSPQTALQDTTSHFIAARALFLLAALFLPFALSACETQDNEAILETTPPPEAHLEPVPTITNPQIEIWRPGYWAMNDRTSFVWVPGKIIPRPSPTAVWSPARWVNHSYGWSFEQGHWE